MKSCLNKFQKSVISVITMKILGSVTLKVYEILMYCNLSAVIHMFFSLSSKLQLDQMNNIGESETKSCLNNTERVITVSK